MSMKNLSQQEAAFAGKKKPVHKHAINHATVVMHSHSIRIGCNRIIAGSVKKILLMK
jgi:hypothetical protein